MYSLNPYSKCLGLGALNSQILEQIAGEFGLNSEESIEEFFSSQELRAKIRDLLDQKKTAEIMEMDFSFWKKGLDKRDEWRLRISCELRIDRLGVSISLLFALPYFLSLLFRVFKRSEELIFGSGSQL